MQKPETEAQTEPLALTEGSYPLRKEEVLEWAQYGVPLQEELEPTHQTPSAPTLPDEPWLDSMDTEDEGQEF
ncbi:hypothetical protein [Helicobacter suis]|uniref:hypothetical protein n=1 Tax=Helicobacter suis TaxID=104628 RepID=UPI0013D0D070|nr:hypothetical protein [Helicobacter suis]